MSVFQVEAGSTSFNAAISACGRGLEWQQAAEILAVMTATRAEPDVITYNASISACEKALQWQWGLQLLSCMLASQVVPNVTCSHKRKCHQ